MIRLKMNELAQRRHFPIISLSALFKTLKGSLLRSQWSDLAEIRTHPRFYVCPRNPHVLKGSDQTQQRKGRDTPIFPIVSQ